MQDNTLSFYAANAAAYAARDRFTGRSRDAGDYARRMEAFLALLPPGGRIVVVENAAAFAALRDNPLPDGLVIRFNAVPAGEIDGSEARQVVLKMRAGEMEFTGQRYLIGFVIPNLTFYPRMAEAIQGSLRKVGIDISGHRSRALTPEMLREATLILCMTESHRMLVQLMVDPVPDGVHLFREFLGDTAEREIGDPFGGPLSLYEAVRDEMVESIPSLLRHLRGLRT